MSNPMSAYLLRDLDRQVVADRGAVDDPSFEMCGHPHWNVASWNQFRAQYGKDPFNARELPPNLESAPEWVFRRMGLRPPLMNGNRPTL